MNIENLTYREMKQVASIVQVANNEHKTSKIDQFYIDKKVIIRTYSAGCWFGTVKIKEGNEVILANARRLHYWRAAKSISLSGVAIYGLDNSKNDLRICPVTNDQWLEAIEIIPCTEEAIKSIEGIEDVKVG